MTTVEERAITATARPRYEGANIRTWIGFKHFMYLAEDAVLEWFRQNGFAPGSLYHRHGLGLEIVDSSVLLPAVLDVDDSVAAEVRRQTPSRFAVRLRVRRAGGEEVALRGKLTVALVRERDAPGDRPPPAELAPLAVSAVDDLAERVEHPAGTDEEVSALLAPAFRHSFRASYVYCHYSDRVQHSAYVRTLEDVVDRFLHSRGLSVSRMLAERGWIPVVSKARVTLTADAHMDEIVHTAFQVRDVLKETTYDATMDCYVRRGPRLLRVAAARIQHGYAISRGEQAGTLARLDPGVLGALTGSRS
ncbi:thioesterase [Amycolatopsis sp. NPDC004079]|uniref:thioesterase n=1 Tax=Amycolatopsis sp. NPDC004079 TaxID=3154549 RepID=UPI0033B01643